MMATKAELLDMARNADAAGDTEAAARFMGMIEDTPAPVESTPIEVGTPPERVHFTNVRKALARGALRGVSKGVLGLANAAENIMGGDPQTGKQVPVSIVNNRMDALIPPPLPAASKTSRYGENIGEFVGQMLPNTMATSKIMSGMAPLIRGKAAIMAGLAPKVAGGPLSTLETPIAASPHAARYLANLGNETASGAVSGFITPTDTGESRTFNTVTGGVMGGIVPALRGAYRPAADFISNLATKKGAEKRVAEFVIDRIGPEKAATTLAQAEAYVPPGAIPTYPLGDVYPHTNIGSRKTVAALTGDPALAIHEAVGRAQDPARYALYDQHNTEAQMRYLDGLTPTDNYLAFAKQERNAVTDPMRDLVKDYVTQPSAALAPIFSRMDSADFTPGTASYKMMREGADALAPAQGGMTSALIKTNRDMADAIGSQGNTRGLFSSVKNDIPFGTQLLSEWNDVLDTSSYGKWGQYLNKHKELSQLPNELEAQIGVKAAVDKAMTGRKHLEEKILLKALAKEAEAPYGSALTEAETYAPGSSFIDLPLTAGSRPLYGKLIDDLHAQENYKQLGNSGNINGMYNDLRVAQGVEGPILSGSSKALPVIRGFQNLARGKGATALVKMQLEPDVYAKRMRQALAGREPPTVAELNKKTIYAALRSGATNLAVSKSTK